MTEMNDVPQLQMIWPGERLSQPPPVVLPPGYRLRTYQPGDERRFFEVMALAGWTGWDEERLKPWLFRMLPQGWFMVVTEAEDLIVATAMATHDHTWLRPFSGEVGWVAGDPAHKGRGLGTAVVAAVTARFIEIGYPSIHLFTEHYRLAALNIYLRLGYMPLLYRPEMGSLWQGVCARLERPFTPKLWPTVP
ncbi:MAG: GNAT family N-acetyltransferase [Anaerolineaceae bacterium]|nr:GNAT family N-acetyltransferase [Anaerolineaceae bacterium]